MFTYCLHIVYILFTYCLHIVYILFTYCLHIVYILLKQSSTLYKHTDFVLARAWGNGLSLALLKTLKLGRKMVHSGAIWNELALQDEIWYGFFTKSRSNVLKTRTFKGTVHTVWNVVWKCSEHFENMDAILYMNFLIFRNDSLELEVNFGKKDDNDLSWLYLKRSFGTTGTLNCCIMACCETFVRRLLGRARGNPLMIWSVAMETWVLWS